MSRIFCSSTTSLQMPGLLIETFQGLVEFAEPYLGQSDNLFVDSSNPVVLSLQ